MTHNKQNQENIKNLRKLNKAKEKEYSPHEGDPGAEEEGT